MPNFRLNLSLSGCYDEKNRSVFLLLLFLVSIAACHQTQPGTESSSGGPDISFSVGAAASESTPLPDVSASLAPASALSAGGSKSSPGPEPESEPAPEPGSESEPAPKPEPESEPAPEPEPESPAKKNTKLYILMYHHFVEGDGTNCDFWSLPIRQFCEDLQWLTDHGYATILPSQLARGEPLPERAVMITLDDGYASNYLLAYPVLQEFNAKAVISIITSGVDDSSNSFYLNWDMCQEMSNSGLVEFGCHTHMLHLENTGNIARLPDESREDYETRVFSDLETSIELIQTNLDTDVLFFAYPGGQVDRWADSFLKEHFAVTVTTKHGPANISNGLYKLPRHNISVFEHVTKFLPA